MLTVRDPRRSRSKSPGGRERSRSRADDRSRERSRDTRDRTYERVSERDDKRYKQDYERDDRKYERETEYYKPSKKRDSSEESRDRRTVKSSSKKYYQSDSDSDRGHRKSKGGRGSRSDSDDSRERKPKKKYYDDDSEEDRRRAKTERYEISKRDDRRVERKSEKHGRRPESRSSESESEPDRHHHKKAGTKSKKNKGSKKDRSDSSSSSSDSDSDRRKKKHDKKKQAAAQPSVYQQPAFIYAQPVAPQYGSVAPQYAAVPAPAPSVPADYHGTRHMSYTGPPQGQHPPGYSGPMERPDLHRAHSSSVSSAVATHGGQYMTAEELQRYRYANAEDFHNKKREEKKEEPQYVQRGDKVYVKTVGPRGEPQYVEVKTAKTDKSEREREWEREREKEKEKEKKREWEWEREREKEKEKEKREWEREMEKKEKEKKSAKYGSPPSPETLAPRLGRMGIAGAGAGALAGGLLAVGNQSSHSGHGKPPASPLLEAYRGTYQSISPMPSPMMKAGSYNNEDVSDLDSLDQSSSSDDGHHIKSIKPKQQLTKIDRKRHDSDVSITEIIPLSPSTNRRVTFYDPEKDAKALEKALNHHHVDTAPLIKIFPHLTSDEILLLRTEYKKHAKVGGAGINISKQIKMKVPGNLGKAVYSTALGRWESEAYWANCWYQGGASRRELLIESLMGRSNSDIHEIKRCFSDKRYNDDLEKCMKAELKADKFRTAILLALEEKRQRENTALDIELVKRDVRDLYTALVGKEGGETAMINIIVVRSDAHLREVMRVFETTTKKNFAREMISKSQNLVGETLAHILNGALNRPMRDALLLHQAIAETAPGKERVELVISRVVRLHWEPKHMERVRMEYMRRYRSDPGAELESEVKGEVAQFLGAMLS